MNGVIVVNKSPGITSHDVVKGVKRLLQVRKAGHTGTLDPLATGVLPVCLNEATKIVQFLINDDKEYEACLRLGIETDTQDMTGSVISTSGQVPKDQSKIIDMFAEFVGNIKQKPPVFSAVKYKGVPLYKWARRGIHVDSTEREISISRIYVSRLELPYVSFEVSCSKGTYIRTLCADIGNRLGCGAHLIRLRRVRSGRFNIVDSHSMEEIEDLAKRGAVYDKIIPLERALIDLPQIKVNGNLERRIKHGNHILVRDLKGISLPRVKAGEKMRISSLTDGLIAIVELLMSCPLPNEKDGGDRACKLIRVFNT